MSTIDAIRKAIELINAGDPTEAAMQLQAIISHLDIIASKQRVGYALIEAYIGNAHRSYMSNRVQSNATRKMHKSEYEAICKALRDLIPAERQEVKQLSLMEA